MASVFFAAAEHIIFLTVIDNIKGGIALLAPAVLYAAISARVKDISELSLRIHQALRTERDRHPIAIRFHFTMVFIYDILY